MVLQEQLVFAPLAAHFGERRGFITEGNDVGRDAQQVDVVAQTANGGVFIAFVDLSFSQVLGVARVGQVTQVVSPVFDLRTFKHVFPHFFVQQRHLHVSHVHDHVAAMFAVLGLRLHQIGLSRDHAPI